MTTRRLGLCLLATFLLAAGCDSDESEPSPTPPASTPVTEMPSPTPSATPAVEVQHTVWLLNLWDDEQYTIYEHPTFPAQNVRFARDRVASVTRASGATSHRGDGRPMGLTELPCEAVATGGVQIGTLLLPEIPGCGTPSPYGRYMLYAVPGPPTVLSGGYPVETWDQWVFDIEAARAGESRLLAEGLVSCGGCDGRFGPQWSPDGRYVLFAETVQDGRVFLADLETGASEVVAAGTDLHYRPSWSSDRERARFLARGEGDTTVLVDAESGERTTLPIGWPASFDATGTFAYSPSATLRHYDSVVTTVVDLATLEVDEVSGAAPLGYLWWGAIAVAALPDDGYTAALEADECAGTIVHSTGRPSRCLEGGYGAVPSRDGRQVAFAALVEGGEAVIDGTRFTRYDIAVLDVETGDIEVVAEGAYSVGELPPRIQWSRFGDLLLVSWPQAVGA